MTATKILCTLGPGTDKPGGVLALAKAGMTAARLNFSHAGADAQKARLDSVRAAEKELGRPLAVIADLQGPKIRLGTFPDGPVELKKGALVTLCGNGSPCTEKSLSMDYSEGLKDLDVGESIFIADGFVHLQVEKIDNGCLHCRVLRGGIVSDHKGVNLPGIPIRMPALTDKDRVDVLGAIKIGCDMIALSFVRSKDDVLLLREILEKENSTLPIIAKLERIEAIENLDEILEVADAIMVARGDLGVEVGIEQVPVLQKRILARAREFNKPAIVATQMLESMVHAPLPTRAEVSDIANAILDGADTVMLSAETAVGEYPVETVTMICKIAEKTEPLIEPFIMKMQGEKKYTIAEALADSVVSMIDKLSIKAVVVNTRTGFTAKLFSKRRLPIPVFVVTPDIAVTRHCAVAFGTTPFEVAHIRQIGKLGHYIDDKLLKNGTVKPGDRIALVAGLREHKAGKTDVVHIIEAGAD